MKTPDTPSGAGRRIRAWLAELTLVRVGIALGLAVLGSIALNPIFITPYPVVLGRMLGIAAALLLVFTAARVWA